MKTWIRRSLQIGGAALAVVATVGAAIKFTTPAQPASAPNADERSMAHYMSDGRRAKLSETLNGFGMDMARRLLASDASETRSWITGDPQLPAPANGYGVLHSAPGASWSAVFVKFTNGKPDLSEGILGLTILTGGHTYTLWGERTLNANGGIVENGPLSWGWTWTTESVKGGQPDLNLTMYIVNAKSGQPDPNRPLDLKQAYKLAGLPKEPAEIEFADRVFIERLKL